MSPSFRAQLAAAKEEVLANAEPDPGTPAAWRAKLARLKGHPGKDATEYVLSVEVHDYLDLPRHKRRGMTLRKVANIMRELGWTWGLVGPRPHRGRGYSRLVPLGNGGQQAETG